MSTKISGFDSRPVSVGGDKSVSRKGTTDADGAQAAQSASPVRITEQARQLAALEQAIQAMPVVNEARIAAIRTAIEDGTYEVHPERIAEKLLGLEQDLNTAES